ncbi:hypothetical protein [Gordonia westfalica]|uniref:Uncharacterized protein n=1 Tax=Gordonia westfalica TaxID=158898 RepID=A0A1H2J345_9ACTN|nr:hypothetical protein [Gordonia westfalica]SDU50877.1 hypothetical protein SAMN04488548_1341687 [Gordonia westfalica]
MGSGGDRSSLHASGTGASSRGGNMIRITAILTLTMLLPSVATSNGSAAMIGRTAPFAPAPTPVHEVNPTAEPTTETYPERLELVGQLQRPRLPTPKALVDEETSCASGDFTTLSVVYDALFESVHEILPPALQGPALAQQAAAHRDMQMLHISTLAVSENPLTLGAEFDDPALRYRSPLSQLLVSGLLKIRDGRESEAIPLGNITVLQAVETVWLYLFATVLIPTRFVIGNVPPLGSPLTGTNADAFAPYVTYNGLLSYALRYTERGLDELYHRTAGALLHQCVARVTDEQRAQAGAPSETVRFDIPIAPIVREVAGHLALADTETCTPIGQLTLRRLVTYVSEQAQAQNPRGAGRIQAETTRLLGAMRGIRIHHNLIPLDPDEERSVGERVMSRMGTAIPIFGGTPLDIMLGISHNLGHGADPWETVSADELTVSKPITAVYYASKLALHFTGLVGSQFEPAFLGDSPFSFTRLMVSTLDLPLAYGLITAHHVIRSMCLRADDTSGTGLGAEANRLPAATPTTTRTPSSPTTNRTPTVPRTSRAIPKPPPAPLIPGLPVLSLPGLPG